MKKEINLIYKPHIFLAKKKSGKRDTKKYIVSATIPVCAAYIKSIEKQEYNNSLPYMKDRFKDCDIYVITVEQKKIKGDESLKIEPIPPLQFVGVKFQVKRVKKKIAVLVLGVSIGTNGHEKDAIHVYDDASEPIYQ